MGTTAARVVASTKAQKAAFEEALEVWDCRNDRIMLKAKVQKKHAETLKIYENLEYFRLPTLHLEYFRVCCNLFTGNLRCDELQQRHESQAERASYEAESRGLKVVAVLEFLISSHFTIQIWNAWGLPERLRKLKIDRPMSLANFSYSSCNSISASTKTFTWLHRDQHLHCWFGSVAARRWR